MGLIWFGTPEPNNLPKMLAENPQLAERA